MPLKEMKLLVLVLFGCLVDVTFVVSTTQDDWMDGDEENQKVKQNDGDRKEAIVQAASADEVVLGDENLDQFTSLVELDDDTAAVERDQEASEKELEGAAMWGGYGKRR